MVVFTIRVPPGRSMGMNLSREGWFMAMTMSACLIKGLATMPSVIFTLQLAVPPRISEP